MKVWRSVVGVLALSLLSAACSGTDTAETATSAAGVAPTVETTVSTTAPTASDAASPTVAGTVTRSAPTTTATTATTTDATVADTFASANVAAAAFNFLAGTSPRFAVLVSIATDPGGPWEPAGDAPGPTLPAGSNFWVQFVVENRSSNATMTELDLSVPGVGDVCPDFVGLGPLGTLECVAGPFVAEAGDREIEFDADAKGFRQGESDESIIDPPLAKAQPFDGAAHSFTLLFAVDLAFLSGALLEGAVAEPAITIEPPELGFAKPVAVDCTDRFPGGFSETGGSPQPGEPPLFAYVITVFDPDGSVADTCSEIPEFESTFKLAEDSDMAIQYAGG